MVTGNEFNLTAMGMKRFNPVQPDDCPFCGYPVGLRNIWYFLEKVHACGTSGNHDAFLGYCGDCGAQGPIADSEDSAVMTWNRRR